MRHAVGAVHDRGRSARSSARRASRAGRGAVAASPAAPRPRRPSRPARSHRRRPAPKTSAVAHGDAAAGAVVVDDLELVGGVGPELVDRDDRRLAEMRRAVEVGGQVLEAPLDGGRVGLVERVELDAAVHLEGPDRGDEHDRGRVEAGRRGTSGRRTSRRPGRRRSRPRSRRNRPWPGPSAWPGSSCSRGRCWRTARRGRTPGVDSVVWTRLGSIASFRIAAIEPVTPISLGQHRLAARRCSRPGSGRAGRGGRPASRPGRGWP